MIPSFSFRGPMVLGLVALVALFAGFGGWAMLAQLQGAIILHGQIVVQDNRYIIQHPDEGIVAQVFVRDGDKVRAGDPLLRLEGEELWSEQRIVANRLVDLSARAARLAAERDGAEAVAFPGDLLAHENPEIAAKLAAETRLFDLRLALYRNEQALLSQRIDQLQLQLDGITAQGAALTAELQLVDAEHADQKTLFDQGLTPQGPVMALGRDAARLRGQIAELAVLAAQTRGQITETDLRISRLHSQRLETAVAELREVEPRLLELAETHRTLSARIERLMVRAPVAGTVLGLQMIKPKGVLQAAAPILSLVPQDQPLVITARLAPEDVDAVYLGQSAEFAVSALAGSDAPRLRGRVSMIAADTLADPQTGAVFYTVELTLDPDTPTLLNDRPLLPGMRVEAFLATTSRSPMTYLLEPFAQFFTHALRES